MIQLLQCELTNSHN